MLGIPRLLGTGCRSLCFGMIWSVRKTVSCPGGTTSSQPYQKLTQNLGNSPGIELQGISAARPKQKFKPLKHSVYVGRQLLGRYERIGKSEYAAFDANDRLLGCYNKPAYAQNAFNRLAAAGGMQ